MIHIDERYCKGCSICIQYCARGVLGTSKEVNSRGFYIPYVVEDSKCASCRQCELLCPDFAIYVIDPQEDNNG